MAMVFTPTKPTPEKSDFIKLGNAFLVPGTITFSGSYATGGDSFTAGSSPSDRAKQIGAGTILAVWGSIRGHSAEWDGAASKLKLYSSANTEHAAAAYNAAVTGSPVPVTVLVR
jgi:hypothetical protein